MSKIVINVLVLAYIISGCLAGGRFLAVDSHKVENEAITLFVIIGNPVYWSYVAFEGEG